MKTCPLPFGAGLASRVVAAVLLASCGGGAGTSNGMSRLAAEERAVSADAPAPLFKLGLSSSSGGTLLPFTVGQPLRQGDVPQGSVLTAADVPELQFVVKNRWPDGSAKFAVLSGRADLGAGTYRSIGLGVAPVPEAAAAPPPLGIGDLKATGITASIGFGAFGTAGWSAGDWDTPVRTIVSGPQMSSWTYRKPIGNDAHLVAWLEVRAYKGGRVEVVPWIENGYLNVAGPTEKGDVAAFTLGGTQRFSQALTLPHHTRAVLAGPTLLTHWLDGADPQVTPQHDTDYFMATRLVPNYHAPTPANSTVFKRLPTEYTPLMQGSFSPGMGTAGYHPSIGLLPEWDVAYLTTKADPRAYRSVLINGYAAGRFAVHLRDETTQRPLAFSSYPNLGMNKASPGVAVGPFTKYYTPAATGVAAPRYITSHHPSMGYMAYLVSGWNYYMEETQLLSTAIFLMQNDSTRQYSKGVIESFSVHNTVRGAAWAIRTLAQAATITPDDHPLRGEFVNSVNENIAHYHGRYVAKPGNSLGLVQPYGSYSTSAPLVSAIWQDDFFTGAFGYLKELSLNAPALQPKLDAFLAWKYRAVIGRLGGGGEADFSYRYGGRYTLNFAPALTPDWTNGTGPWYGSWGEVARSMNLGTDADVGASLAEGYPHSAAGYWGNMAPALAYAIDHQAQGADAAWQRVITASNFPILASDCANLPVWCVRPRTKDKLPWPGAVVPSTPPAPIDPTLTPLPQPEAHPVPEALSNLQPGQWLELPNTKIRSVLPDPLPQGDPAAIVTARGSGTADTLRSRLLVWGGGAEYYGNEVYALDLPTLSIQRVVDPSARTAESTCTSALPDGTPTARRPHDGLTYMAHADAFFSNGGALAPCTGGNGSTWLHDFATGTWTDKKPMGMPNYAFGVMAKYDPVTRRVFLAVGDSVYTYSAETNTGTRLRVSPMLLDTRLTSVIDPKRHVMVAVGNGVQVINLNAGQDDSYLIRDVATTNAPAFVISRQAPGLAYDPVSDRIVAWHGGSNVYTLNLDTLEWTQVASGAGPTAAGQPNGTYGRWAYIPLYNVFALVNSIDQNAWVFRLTNAPAATTPAPDGGE